MASTNFSTLTNMANKWINKLAPLLLLLAICWLCWNIARIVWLFVAPPIAPNLAPVAKQLNTNMQANPQSTFAFFTQPEPKPQNTVAAKPSNIILKGVMTAKPIENSSAVIKVNGVIKSYRVGKQLEDTQYTLVDVQWNQITIEDNQQNTSIISLNPPLDLNQELIQSTSDVNSKPINSDSNLISNIDTPSPVRRTSPPTNMAKKGANTAPINDSDTLDEMNSNTEDSNINTRADNAINNAINQLKQDPTSYLSRMGVASSNQGYEVTSAMPEDIRNRIGLQSGDRVLSVNGQSVGSNPMADSELLQQVKESGQAQIQVKRGEQVITIRQQF